MIKEKVKKFNVNKITPLHDLSWYIKWISSIIILIGMLWHDRALIFLNAVAIAVFIMGIVKYHTSCTNCMIPL